MSAVYISIKVFWIIIITQIFHLYVFLFSTSTSTRCRIVYWSQATERTHSLAIICQFAIKSNLRKHSIEMAGDWKQNTKLPTRKGSEHRNIESIFLLRTFMSCTRKNVDSFQNEKKLNSLRETWLRIWTPAQQCWRKCF